MRPLALVVALSNPMETNHGGTLRLRAHRAALEDLGYRVEFEFPRSAIGNVSPVAGRSDSLFTVMRRRAGVLKRNYLPMPTAFGARDRHLTDRVTNSKPDLLVLTALSQRGLARVSDARIWFDFMDIWSEVADRESRRRRGAARLTARLQVRVLERAEAKISSQASFVTTTGWSEHESLQRRGVDNTWVPTALPDDVFQTQRHRSDPVPRRAGFLANFEYWPNIDAYNLLVENWLPTLRRLGWSLVVAGRHTEVLGRVPDGVTSLGFVEDLANYYSAIDVSVAPMRAGGGMKVKVLESLAHGVPVVGTDFAFEGFDPRLRQTLAVVAETSPDFSPLEEIARTRVPSEALNPYKLSSVTATLKHLLDGKTR